MAFKREEIEQLAAQKRFADILGMKLIDHKDKKIISIVQRELRGFKTGAKVSLQPVSIYDALTRSIESYRLFGEDTYQKIKSIVSGIPIRPIVLNENMYLSHVQYHADDVTHEIIKDSGEVKEYKIPVEINETASVYLGHEHIHALKETNYEEYIYGFVYGDVIPLLYELIVTKDNSELRNKLLKSRLDLLQYSNSEYSRGLVELRKCNNRDKELVKLFLSRHGEYLNSFYYALILYNMYKDNPEFIISKMKQVLNHEMTTVELLAELGLLYRDKSEVFKSELNNLKK